MCVCITNLILIHDRVPSIMYEFIHVSIALAFDHFRVGSEKCAVVFVLDVLLLYDVL